MLLSINAVKETGKVNKLDVGNEIDQHNSLVTKQDVSKLQCQKATATTGNQNRNKKKCTTSDSNHCSQGQVKTVRTKPNDQQIEEVIKITVHCM